MTWLRELFHNWFSRDNEMVTPDTPPIEDQKISQAGIDLIKKFEGFRAKAYKCPGDVWTIGYGTTTDVKPGMLITKKRAEELLHDDIAGFEMGVCDVVEVDLTQHQFDALVSFSYNVGLGALRKSTLLKKLNAGDYKGAANEMLRWNRAGGKVLAGLKKRRDAERKLFLS